MAERGRLPIMRGVVLAYRDLGRVARAMPRLVAVHRLIILDEVTPHYSLALREKRFLRFFAWTLVPALVLAAGGFVQTLLTAAELPARAGSLGGGGALLVGLFVILRLLILFPAIAGDGPGASARHAFAARQG